MTNAATITTLPAIRDAAAAVRSRVHRTPLLTSASLARRLGDRHEREPAAVLLKAEAFKKQGRSRREGCSTACVT